MATHETASAAGPRRIPDRIDPSSTQQMARILLDERDNEIEKIEHALSQAEQVLFNIDVEGEAAILALQREINELNEELADVRSQSELLMTDLVAKHQQELEQTKRIHDNEFAELVRDLETDLKQYEFEEMQSIELTKLDNAERLTEMSNELERMKSAFADKTLRINARCESKIRKAEARSSEFVTRNRQLERELERLAEEERCEREESEKALKEVSTIIDSRIRDHEVCVAEAKKAIAQQKVDYELKLTRLSEKFAAEAAALEFEIKRVTEEAEAVEETCNFVEAHNKRKIRVTMRDIDNLKSAIAESKMAKKEESKGERLACRRLKKAKRAKADIARDVEVLKAEIERLELENEELTTSINSH